MRPDLFNHTVSTLRYGQTLLELSEQLSEAVRAAIDTGKTAEITLKLKIKPEANGKQVFFSDDIKTKIPQLAREQTILFPTPDGNLTRDDPRQAAIPGLREAPKTVNGEFKTA